MVKTELRPHVIEREQNRQQHTENDHDDQKSLFAMVTEAIAAESYYQHVGGMGDRAEEGAPSSPP